MKHSEVNGVETLYVCDVGVSLLFVHSAFLCFSSCLMLFDVVHCVLHSCEKRRAYNSSGQSAAVVELLRLEPVTEAPSMTSAVSVIHHPLCMATKMTKRLVENNFGIDNTQRMTPKRNVRNVLIFKDELHQTIPRHTLDSLERPRRPATSAGRTFVFRPAKGDVKRHETTKHVGNFQNHAAKPAAEVALPQTGRFRGDREVKKR